MDNLLGVDRIPEKITGHWILVAGHWMLDKSSFNLKA
jgi:hypothetical protein